MSDHNRTSRDLNIQLILEALRTGTEILLIPRRSYKIKGVPVRYDRDTYRIYIDTGRNIETVLLGEIGHASFPRELYQAMRRKENDSNSPRQQAEKIADMITEERKKKKPKKKEKKPSICVNCGKETINNRMYCDEKCFKEYRLKKESETPFMDKVKSGELKPRDDVPDS